MAQLKSARSRNLRPFFSCCRIAQMCLGFSGGFGPINRPAFQGLAGSLKRSG